jgi:phenylacetate-CoA ligase
MFVQPRQVGDVLRRHELAGKARLVVTQESGHDEMRLLCEVEGQPAGLAGKLAETVRSLTGLRATVELVVPGTLPNDGRVIDDQR